MTQTLQAVPADQRITAFELTCGLDTDCDVDFVDLLTLVANLGASGTAHSDGAHGRKPHHTVNANAPGDSGS